MKPKPKIKIGDIVERIGSDRNNPINSYFEVVEIVEHPSENDGVLKYFKLRSLFRDYVVTDQSWFYTLSSKEIALKYFEKYEKHLKYQLSVTQKTINELR